MTSPVLAFDTAGPIIAVGFGGHARTERVSRGAEARLVPWAMELTDGLREVRAIAVCVGPGAFTGIRVGLATAQGFAHALGVPLFGFGALRIRGEAAGADVALLDARKGRVYVGWADQGWVPADLAPDVALERGSPGFTATGEGATVYASAVERAGGRVLPDADDPGILRLVALGAEALARGDAGDPLAVGPMYVRAPDAEPRRA